MRVTHIEHEALSLVAALMRVALVAMIAVVAWSHSATAAATPPATDPCGQPSEGWGAAEADGIAVTLRAFALNAAAGTPADPVAQYGADVSISLARQEPAQFGPADFVLTTCDGRNVAAADIDPSLRDLNPADPSATGVVRFRLGPDETPLALTIVTQSPGRSPGSITFPLRTCDGGAAGASARGGDGLPGSSSGSPSTPSPTPTPQPTPFVCPPATPSP